MNTKMDFAFMYDFKYRGHAFTSPPSEREQIRIDRMVVRLESFAEKKNIEGYVYVDFIKYGISLHFMQFLLCSLREYL